MHRAVCHVPRQSITASVLSLRPHLDASSRSLFTKRVKPPAHFHTTFEHNKSIIASTLESIPLGNYDNTQPAATSVTHPSSPGGEELAAQTLELLPTSIFNMHTTGLPLQGLESDASDFHTRYLLWLRRHAFVPLSRSLHSQPLLNGGSVSRMARLIELVQIHDQHLDYQSTASYNILLEAAITHGRWFWPNYLFQRMQRRGIPMNRRTWRLKVRWYSVLGNFARACKTAYEAPPAPDIPFFLPTRTERMAFDFWLECLRMPMQHPARMPLPLPPRRNQHSHSTNVEEFPMNPTEPLMSKEFAFLFHPSVMPDLSVPHTLRSAQKALIRILRYLLRMKRPRPDIAMTIVQRIIDHLPRSSLSHSQAQLSITLVNELLRVFTPKFSGHEIPLQSPGGRTFRAMRRRFDYFISLHPDLRPNPETLVHLLWAAKGAHNRVEIMEKLMAEFETRWGPDSVCLYARMIVVREAIQYLLGKGAKPKRRVDVSALAERMVRSVEDALQLGRDERLGEDAELEVVEGWMTSLECASETELDEWAAATPPSFHDPESPLREVYRDMNGGEREFLSRARKFSMLGRGQERSRFIQLVVAARAKGVLSPRHGQPPHIE